MFQGLSEDETQDPERKFYSKISVTISGSKLSNVEANRVVMSLVILHKFEGKLKARSQREA